MSKLILITTCEISGLARAPKRTEERRMLSSTTVFSHLTSAFLALCVLRRNILFFSADLPLFCLELVNSVNNSTHT